VDPRGLRYHPDLRSGLRGLVGSGLHWPAQEGRQDPVVQGAGHHFHWRVGRCSERDRLRHLHQHLTGNKGYDIARTPFPHTKNMIK